MDKKLLATMMVFIIAACALFAVVDQSEADGTKTLVIETSPDFAPYDYLYGDEFAGIDMDIIRAVCKEIGYKPQFRQNNFDSIIMSVQQHKTDMGASGFTIDEDRKKNVDFTESYTTVKQVVVVLKDSPIKTLEDVKGKRISVQTGTTGAKYAEGVTGIDNISYQKGYPEVVLDILNKKADCEIVDDAVAKAQVANNPKLEIRDILTDAETEYYGFIFAKDNTALYNLFNDALKKLIADGTVGKILDYYADNGYSENTPPYNFSKNKKLVVETSPDFPPYEYLLGEEYVGIDMDIVRAIADRLGYTVEFRQNNFDSIIMSVQQHKTDFGASGFTIDEDRKAQVNFSTPYAEIKQVVVVKKNSSITTLDDVKGKKISVQSGTSGAAYAEGVSSNIIYQKSYNEVLLDVLKGKVDCEIVDRPVAEAQVANNKDLEIRNILTDAETEYYGLIFAKDNTALYEEINGALEALMADGTVDRIVKYYADNGFSTDTPSYYNQGKKVIVETSPDFPPYEYLLGEEYVGIDMDIVRAIADRLGYTVEFRQNNFDSIIMSVQQHKTDFGASGFTIDEDRKAQVNFSTPYAEIKQVVVVKKNSPISNLEDVKGKKISVQSGTSGAAYAEGVSSNIIYQKSYNEVLLDVLKGKADCEIVDRPVAEAQVANNPELEIRDILIDAETEYYGLIFAKDNTEMYSIINGALERIIANGTVDKIVAYYAENGFSTDTPSYFNQGGGSTGGDDDDGEDDGFFATLWKKFKKDFLDNDRYNYIFKGLKNTLTITVLALIIGMGIGAVAAMVRSTHDQTGRFPIANAICRLYITVIRGTPVMVQLLIIYYVVFASVNLNQILIASVAFGLNSGAYVAEVFRSGINSVPKGQMEACRSLGMNNGQAMKKVIMPQALRNILPALGNEGISLLKETSVAGYIGIVDLTRAGDLIRGQTYDALLPLLVVALIYLAIVLVLTYLVKRLERRLNNAY